MKRLLAMIFCCAALFGTTCAEVTPPRTISFDNPKMKVFLSPAELANGKAIVCCPGGGYYLLATGHEGYDWVPFFNGEGVALAVLEYRMPKGDREIPMDDVRRAFKILTDSAAAWRIDPKQIGIMGSSAGGHLASAIATHPTPACNPAFQLLFYPVASLDKTITHKGTRQGFIGKDGTDDLAAEYSAENKVSASTPRAFIIHCGDDDVVHPQNALRYYSALQAAGVPATLLMYPKGGHGWGIWGPDGKRQPMLDEISSWLKTF